MISCFWIALMLLLVTLTLVTVVAALAYLQPRWFMAALRWLSPSVLWTFDTDMKIAALTIDDAPMEHINEILTVLKEYGVHATFFVIGSYTKTESGRAAIERILDETVELQQCFEQRGALMTELTDVVLVKTPEETANECADVANFCMMVADSVTQSANEKADA